MNIETAANLNAMAFPSFMGASDVIASMHQTGLWTAPWLAVNAFGSPILDGFVSVEKGASCAFCGHHFLPGEKGLINPTHTSQAFNDGPAMSGGSIDPVCGACMAIQNKVYLQNVAKCIVTPSGIWNFGSNQDIAWWVLNPPSEPFSMVHSLAEQQHLYWRTPVSRSRDVFQIRVGAHMGFVRRAMPKDLSESMSKYVHMADCYAKEQFEIKARLEAAPGSKPKKSRELKFNPKVHAFVRLDRAMASPDHGALKTNVAQFIASGKAPREMMALTQINAIELWALAAIINVKAADVHASMPKQRTGFAQFQIEEANKKLNKDDEGESDDDESSE